MSVRLCRSTPAGKRQPQASVASKVLGDGRSTPGPQLLKLKVTSKGQGKACHTYERCGRRSCLFWLALRSKSRRSLWWGRALSGAGLSIGYHRVGFFSTARNASASLTSTSTGLNRNRRVDPHGLGCRLQTSSAGPTLLPFPIPLFQRATGAQRSPRSRCNALRSVW